MGEVVQFRPKPRASAPVCRGNDIPDEFFAGDEFEHFTLISDSKIVPTWPRPDFNKPTPMLEEDEPHFAVFVLSATLILSVLASIPFFKFFSGIL